MLRRHIVVDALLRCAKHRIVKHAPHIRVHLRQECRDRLCGLVVFLCEALHEDAVRKETLATPGDDFLFRVGIISSCLLILDKRVVKVLRLIDVLD